MFKVRNLALRVDLLEFHSIEGSSMYLIGFFALKLKGGIDMVSFLIAKPPGFRINSFSFVVIGGLLLFFIYSIFFCWSRLLFVFWGFFVEKFYNQF